MSQNGEVEWAFEDSKRVPLSKDFVVGRQLGEGKFSLVYYARHKKTGQEVAIKCISREETTPDELVHEAMLVQLVDSHPGIVKILDVYEDYLRFYLVMEYVAGGELFDKIVEKDSYTEREAGNIVAQIATIIEYIHSKNVVHRDIKPENLLCADHTTNKLKLCDFGLADTIEENELLTAIVGSVTYMAPEVAKGHGYNKSVDMYSLGVVLYILLCGYPPFEPAKGFIELEFPPDDWKQMSPGVITLIKRMLSSVSDERPTATQFLRHPWVRGEQASRRKLVGTIKSIKIFNEIRKKEGTENQKMHPTKDSIFTIFGEDCENGSQPLRQPTVVEPPKIPKIEQPKEITEEKKGASKKDIRKSNGDASRKRASTVTTTTITTSATPSKSKLETPESIQKQIEELRSELKRTKHTVSEMERKLEALEKATGICTTSSTARKRKEKEKKKKG